MDDSALFPAATEAPARFLVSVEIPRAREADDPVTPDGFTQAITRAAALCPGLLGACMAESVTVSVLADLAQVPVVAGMAWQILEEACGAGAMKSARLRAEPATVTPV